MIRVASICVALLTSGNAFAAEGGTSQTAAETPQQKCQKIGKVYNKETKKCEAKKSSMNQDSLFESGREFAYAGQYQEALAIFDLAPNQLDPRLLNMKGYSYRKLGQVEKAMAFYKHSIALDPKYSLVREYYGEALLQTGDVDAAKIQLTKIREICSSENCESYQQLFAAISNHQAGQPAVSRW